MHERVAEFVSSSSNRETEEGEADDEDAVLSLPRPCDIFHVGQLIRAVIINIADVNTAIASSAANSNFSSATTARRIELSMRPSLLNRSLAFDLFHPGLNLCGAIKSIEDKGFLLDFGPNADFTAFLAFKDCSHSYSPSASSSSVHDRSLTRLQVGFPCECIVKSVNKQAKTVALSLLNTASVGAEGQGRGASTGASAKQLQKGVPFNGLLMF